MPQDKWRCSAKGHIHALKDRVDNLITVKLSSSVADFSVLNESCVVNNSCSVRRNARTLNS